MPPSEQNPYTTPTSEFFRNFPQPHPDPKPLNFGGWLIIPILILITIPICIALNIIIFLISLFDKLSRITVEPIALPVTIHSHMAPGSVLFTDYFFDIGVLIFCIF